MLDFGDEFAVEGYGVSWLLWVQLIVMILLVIVLFCGFSVIALDRCSNNPTTNGPSSSSQSQHKDPLLNNSNSKQVESNQRFESKAETSRSKEIIEDEIDEREESSAKDIALFRLLRQGGHPCDYFGLAKQAILKCFGLGYSESCHSRKHRKED